MPPKKRYVSSLKIGLTDFEMLLLACMRIAAGGTYVDHLRSALRYYAKHNPNLREFHVREFFKARLAPNFDADERKRLLAEIDAFFAADVTIEARRAEDSVSLSLPFKGTFDSSKLALDEDE